MSNPKMMKKAPQWLLFFSPIEYTRRKRRVASYRKKRKEILIRRRMRNMEDRNMSLSEMV